MRKRQKERRSQFHHSSRSFPGHLPEWQVSEGESLQLICSRVSLWSVRLLIAACLYLSTVSFVYSQERHRDQLPDAPVAFAAPSPSSQPSQAPMQQDEVVFQKKVFWSLVAVDAGSAIADAQISRTGLRTCPNYREQNSWLYGLRPTLGRYYATNAVMDSGSAFLAYKLLHSHYRIVRMLGWLPLAVTTGGHADGAIRWAGVIGNRCGSGN
jgi:hypothetical protein